MNGASASNPHHDPRIAADVEALRTRCEDTRELYREVCALLFFRYGITPTANRLYQYVRKGSMGTPSEVLARFWADLRERARVRIERPDLPEALRDAAGAMVHDLWTRALDEAARSFDARRDALGQALDAARDDERAAREALDAERVHHADTRRALEASRTAALDLTRQLAIIQGRLTSATELMREGGEEVRRLRGELASAQRDLARASGEANALRVQLAIASRRRAGKPVPGVPMEAEPGQEALALDPRPDDK